ncbi:Fanconi anemia group M protein [Maniola jurtina]|uniref:Fanconi anemia group M protein n=1 Tax=Maniola jurtina TaxID=191418 RepID=UPI001E688CFE|nr:Fanconi anemia group M protein [Maniola jurtina]XP_045766128.1 Fanconi anemia group M protein [Maniola jurtina]XP_045766129.1 Fanconi anemia group M protein [Maniola jurtina]
MANNANKSCNLFDDEFFDDSSLLANFDNSAFNQIPDVADKSVDKSFLNVSALCCDEELSGYDKITGKTWVYPTNYPVRDYQFNIIRAAILKNTLVSLPTGLGKTFIAAVIMYNYYRWYPLGKIVFTAPTRPLVAQQIEACYKIVALPPTDTIEMTGHMPVNTRKTHWQTKRVFFATPQVIYNDIKSGICPAQKIRCLVIDEAHRARGNYAYCQIVSTLTEMGHTVYRVLGLSATPGSKVEDVISVVKNLHIAHLELRTEACIDVASYSHSRKINTVVIPLGPELTHLRRQYVEILDGYARRLKQFNILPQNLGNLSKGRIVMLYKEYQTRDRSSRHPQHNYIMKDFTLIISLFHGLELLVKHGSRVFLNFFDEHPEKSWIQSDDQLTSLLERLRDDLGIDPLSLDRSVLPDGTIPEIPKDLSFGHPKFDKLKEIILDHFNKAKQNGQDTKAIVFCEYRESVNLVHCLLLQCRPLIVPQMFVGQGASGKNGKTVVSQKQQLRVMRSFRSGECNTLVCTCVAEEGLDVGSVDLILCFDISTRSPVRLVQRCGRTGRERGGQVHILVTEGREHQTLLDCMRQRDGLNKKILQSKEVENNLYKLNPRMIPRDFMPECQKMFITVPNTDNKDDAKADSGKSKKGQKDLRNMLLGRASTSKAATSKSDVQNKEWLTKEEFDAIFPHGYRDYNYFADPVEYSSMSKERLNSQHEKEDCHLRLEKWLELQRTLQETVNIGHSVDTNILAELLQYTRTGGPDILLASQNPTPNTQDVFKRITVTSPSKPKQTKKKQKATLTKSPIKNGDIRALFSTATKSTKNYTKLINDLDIDGNLPTRVINLLVDLTVEQTNSAKQCYFCENVCNCLVVKKFKSKKSQPLAILNDKTPYLPDIDLIDNLTADVLLKYVENKPDIVLDLLCEEIKSSPPDNKEIAPDNKEIAKNFDLQFDFGFISDSPEEEKITPLKSKEIKDTNFDIGDLDDIFADSNLPEMQYKDEDSSDPNKTLEYFGLDSFEDIFAESDDEVSEAKSNNKAESKIAVNAVFNSIKMSPINTKERSVDGFETNTNSVVNTRPASPSLLSGKPTQIVRPSTSPIFSSQFKSASNIQSSTPSTSVKKKLNLGIRKNVKVTKSSRTTVEEDVDTVNKSMFTITQLVNMINQSDNKSPLSKNCTGCNEITAQNKTDNVCDRSSSPIFLTQRDRGKSIYSESKPSISNETDKQNRFDNASEMETSPIFLTQQNRQKNESYNLKEQRKSKSRLNTTPSVIIPDSDSDFEELMEMSDDKLLKGENKTNRTPNKRKLCEDDDDDITASPYFIKKQKLHDSRSKALTLQEKVLSALTSSKNIVFGNNTQANFMINSPSFKFEKENNDPSPFSSPETMSDGEKLRNNLAKLQLFRRDSNLSPRKPVLNDSTNMSSINLLSSRKLRFDDSDDDFVDSEKIKGKQRVDANNTEKRAIKHKVKKKRNKASEFLDLEAALSDCESASGDELSDDSAGSIVDFICDNNVSHDEEDMHALYLKSVKSTVNGVFKIPQLPNKYDKHEVLSQYVEEDAYEMDSFCVDSHIGLTQIDEVSQLELAEMRLKEKRKCRKTSKAAPKSPKESGDSPVVRRKRKNAKMQIQSDSEDSS